MARGHGSPGGHLPIPQNTCKDKRMDGVRGGIMDKNNMDIYIYMTKKFF